MERSTVPSVVRSRRPVSVRYLVLILRRLVRTDGSTAYRSADGGVTWSSVPIGSGITGAILATDPASGMVYLGYANSLLIASPFRPNTIIAGTSTSAWQITSSRFIRTHRGAAR